MDYKSERLKRGLTQTQVAALIGSTQANISNIETGLIKGVYRGNVDKLEALYQSAMNDSYDKMIATVGLMAALAWAVWFF